MAKYKYTSTDLDSADKLLSTIGSYWATTYLGMDLLSDALKAKANLTAQTWVNFMELVASISRFNVPVFHQETWHPLVVKKSEVNAFTALVPVYETGSSNPYDQAGELE